MSETWAVAIVGLGFAAICGCLAWIANVLLGIKDDLRSFVLKEDCLSEMNKTCSDIGELWTEVRKTQDGLKEVKTKQDIYHGSKK